MRIKKFLSMLLVFCTIIGLLPTVSLADEGQSSQATQYHIFTALPTETIGSETSATLYLGAPVNGVFYGMNSNKQGANTAAGAYYTATDAASQQYTLKIRYAGSDATYGKYYNLIFTNPGGSSYVVAYDSRGFFAQNLLTNGLPSGGFVYKHRFYYDTDAQIFYHRPETGKTEMKGLKISKSSYRLFVETAANLKAANENTAYAPVRLYEICISDNIAGSDATHTWSGSCSCGHKFDYQERTEETYLGYHRQTGLPTVENPEISGDFYLGAVIADTFYGMNGSGFSSNAATTSTDMAEQNKITVLYGGVDATYGTYYYMTYTLPNGTAYTFAYAGGYFTQNKLTDGLPTDGWAAKHKLFYDSEAQIFYHRPAADMTVMKGLKLSTASFKLFTETVSNLKTPSAAYVPVGLYAHCNAEGAADSNGTHHWNGICSCGDKVGYAAHDEVADWNVKTAEGHSKVCSCGYVIEETKTHNMPAQWTEDPDTGLVYKICSECGYRELKDHTHAYSAVKFDEASHWTECICGEKSEAASHSMGQWTWDVVPETLADTGVQKRTCEDCEHFETRENTLSAEEFSASANPPAADVPFYLGATQLQVTNTPTYFFKGVWAPSKYVNMDVTTDMYAAQAMYAEETQDGYKLYFDNNGVKTYLVVVDATINESKGVFVQPVTDANQASTFKWNNQYATYQTNVPDKGDYYIGLYTDDNGTAYTKLQALLVSGLGRDDRHPSKVYMRTTADHTHNFSAWNVLSTPANLQDQGKEKRKCTICGYEEIHVITLTAEDFTNSTNPPATGVPFYLGATQRQVKNKPTYFFKGVWAPSKYLNMDVSTKMEEATAMYAEAVNGGYKLYFDNSGVKTYLVIVNTTINGAEGVFVQPVTKASRASVFMWNSEYGTFYTNVPSKGDYYIGLYTTDEGTAYTKLQALLVTGLGRNDRHPAKVYLRTYDHKHTFGNWVSKSYATHLNDQGVQERACTGCSYVQARVVMLSPNNYKPATSAPRSGSTFYLGATQLQIEDQPTHFFLGQWLPRKFQRMDVTADMKKSALMYIQAVDGGYKLYFINEGVKTYLTIAEMTVEGDRSVFVQPVTDSEKASVFQWNQKFCTYQTRVEGKGDYCIGNYTEGDIKYTKLSALPVSGLESDHLHPAVPFVLR